MDENVIDVREEVADAIQEFIEVAIHSIIYVREVYPSILFEKRIKYNIPVNICTNAGVRSYVSKVLATFSKLLTENAVKKFAVVILNANNYPIEKFVFDIEFPCKQNFIDEGFLSKITEELKLFCLKINTADGTLKSNPPGCRFVVHIYTNRNAAVKLNSDQSESDDFPWIEADTCSEGSSTVTIVPLKTMASQIYTMQLYVIEGNKRM